jgi:hypothetical protein
LGSTFGTIINNSANWDTGFSERRQWDGGSTNLTAATGRTSLGASTVGGNLFTLTNPSAISFLQINADNSVTTQNAATFRSSIGAGTGNGSVTSIATTSPVQGGTITGTGTISLNLATDFSFTTPQTITLTDAFTNTSGAVLTLTHLSSGTPTTNFGTTLWSRLENSAPATVDAGQLQNNWSNAVSTQETSYYDFQLRNAGAGLASKMRLHGSGGLSVGHTTDPLAGYVSANTGFKIGATDIFPITTARGGVPAAGTTGQVLAKTSGTDYAVAWKTYASAQVTSPTNPPAVTSTSGLMIGFGTATYGPFTFTPTVSGKVLIILNCEFTGGTAGSTVSMSLRYGTGTAPTNGAAPAGTVAMTTVRAGAAWGANQYAPLTLTVVVTGLTVNTAYWIDLTGAASAGTAQVTGGYLSAVELP